MVDLNGPGCLQPTPRLHVTVSEGAENSDFQILLNGNLPATLHPLTNCQPAVGTRQLHHGDGLPALSSGEPPFASQPTGLVAGETGSHLPAASGELASPPAPGKLTVAQILRGGAARYVREHVGGGASPQVQSTLAKLSLCRTPALGGRSYQCDDCGEVTEVFHSCGDRHCPQCAGRKRYDFAARAGQLILPRVTYYQVVFTLPGELSELALANRLAIADLLFASAWKSLRKTIRTQQGYDPAAMMVLHIWNQVGSPAGIRRNAAAASSS